jgi:hypothetical protein
MEALNEDSIRSFVTAIHMTPFRCVMQPACAAWRRCHAAYAVYHVAQVDASGRQRST